MIAGAVLQLAWVAVCWRHMLRLGHFKTRQSPALALCIALLLAAWLVPGLWAWALTGVAAFDLGLGCAAWLAAAGVLLFADGLGDEEPFSLQWPFVAVPPLLCAVAAWADCAEVATGGILWVAYLLFCLHERQQDRRAPVLLALVYALLSCAAFASGAAASAPVAYAAVAAELCVHAVVLDGFASLRRGFESQAERFQGEVLAQQYDEIRSIYLNMRGWRHDYHNHLQVMKAELAAGQIDELAAYLDELECDLDRVDSYVKSGNLMLDAILNSKLSLAAEKGVGVNCKAVLPEEVAVDDVDLCVVFGNLLDNALESCEALPPDERWLRIYVAARGNMLYASIQNAAVEDPSFEQRAYISNKRGEHGFGMKRVAAVVSEYGGSLRLANEPGIFAAEVSLPV